MRPQTLRLLDRLGEPDYRYREYGGEADGDPAAAWPLFVTIRRKMASRRPLGQPKPRLVHLQEPDAVEGRPPPNSLSALMMRIPDEGL